MYIGSMAGADDDLEVNIYGSYSYQREPSPVRQYKSYQPTITVQPTEVIYREENSRAAPRKGIEVIKSYFSCAW